MNHTRIKICGITTTRDATACHDLGANYLGVIFAESPRKVALGRATEIRSAAPDASLVGVFADEPIETVVTHARACMLNMIQLHGNELPDYCTELRKNTLLPIIKAIRGTSPNDPVALDAYSSVRFFLLDLEKGAPGRDEGLPESLMTMANRAGRQGHRILLAGGLDPGNVRQALDAARPFGVDVCRGVECEPGKKDLAKVERFIKEVRAWHPEKQ